MPKNQTKAKPKKGKPAPMAQAKGDSQSPQRANAPVWWSMTTLHHEFVSCAAALDSCLKQIYGRDMSISLFVKGLSEIPTLSSSDSEKIHLPAEVLDLYDRYSSAKTARDEERLSFRASIDVQNVSTGLEAARKLIAERQEESKTQ